MTRRRQRRRHQPGRLRGSGRRRCCATPACRCRSASSAATTCCPRLDELGGGGRAASITWTASARYDEIRGRVVAANAYIGALPVAEAHRAPARASSSPAAPPTRRCILAPLVHESRLGAGTIGTASPPWHRRRAHPRDAARRRPAATSPTGCACRRCSTSGYPIAEVATDGDVRRHQAPRHRRPASRRARSPSSCLYEIGDPRAYLDARTSAPTSPRLQLPAQDGTDRVRVSGARGAPAPATLKVSMVYRHGYRAVGTVLHSGPNVIAKGERLGGDDLASRRHRLRRPPRRLRRLPTRAGRRRPPPLRSRTRSCSASPSPTPTARQLNRFATHLLGFALQGPPGLGIFGGRPDVQEAFGFWPALLPRQLVDAVDRCARRPRVHLGGSPWRWRTAEHPARPVAAAVPLAGGARRPIRPPERVRLGTIAYARSGDKGRSRQHRRCARALTRGLRVPASRHSAAKGVRAASSATWSPVPVVRHELPNLPGVQLLLHQRTRRRGTLSLRVDHQGKTLAQGLLTMEPDVPDDVLASVGRMKIP